MVCLGFTKTFLICAAAMSLNILTGLLFLPKESEDSVSGTAVRRKSDNVISLKIIGEYIILLYVSIYYYMLVYIIICKYILLYVSIYYYM